jgi:glycosyltransferase involved in cell wall biosynthesis
MSTRSSRLKLLQILPYPAFPDSSGGRIRVVQLAKALTLAGIDVTVLTPWHPRQKASRPSIESFKLFQARYPFVLPLIFTDRPFPYQYLTSFHPGLSLSMRHALTAFDIYQFEHVQFSSLVHALPRSAIVVYSSHNVEHDYVIDECSANWTRRLAGRRIRRLEHQLLQRSQHTFAVSELDRRRLGQLYSTSIDRITVAPNGISSQRKRQGSEHLTILDRFPRLVGYATRILYSGSNVEHNRIAVKFILEHCAPGRPDSAFVIHGTCGMSFARRCNLDNVFFDPSSSCLDGYSELGFSGINPVSSGSGTNLKVLNYLALGMPVLTTPFGMRGYDDLKPFVTVRDLDDFVSAIGTVAPSQHRVEQVLKKYQWDKIADSMIAVYKQLIG